MTVFGPLGPSLAPWLRSFKGFRGLLKSHADWYANLAGYRQMGLKYDDLLIEERPDVERAINRLTPRETYDRSYRFKRASHQSVLHKNLPKDQWITKEEDIRYLRPHVEEVVKEDNERKVWESLAVSRK
ncbi:ubiquinol-cytochrome-c reductase complex subunit 6 [Cristinia sonorae]|uniref:Complex III subunit 7 n=1 Tax=Cristinia sonorae TaxID=1940300 RepID=A0A8K0V2N0_9AGAR|nr:ubiquinol-cytochrome-c reductase complex subunit 6 [Cristinia sonorae]